MEREELEEKIDAILTDYVDVPNNSYFTNYKKHIGGDECYCELVKELADLLTNKKE